MELYLIMIVAAPFAAALLAPAAMALRVPAPGWLLSAAPAAALWGCAMSGQALIAGGAPLVFRVPWIPAFGIGFSLYFDGLTLCFAALISLVGVLITIYAGAYLKGHPDLGRFFAVFLSFMGAMLGLVMAGDVVTLFVFWELTSITSYLLIGFDHRDAKARASALQALLVTGGGGLALLAGLVLLGHAAGGYGYAEILGAGSTLPGHPLAGACLVLILLGAFTKSAQFPFHFWLPNAMAAPAPVSAYLHSSTMVKAGVYLLARLSPVFAEHAWWGPSLLAAGGATAGVSAWLALRQTKMKPLLAYTTLSALGTLTAFIGIGTPAALKAMLLFLFVHAFYKAALFMVAGTLEHETGRKDAEELGGLGRLMPWTAAAAALAGLSMAGIPPLLGFIGKEVLYESALATMGDPQFLGWFGIFLGLLVAANAVNVHAALMMGWRPFWARASHAADGVHEGGAGLWLGPALLATLGLALGLYSAPLSGYLLLPGLRSFLPDAAAPKLALWHGFNSALGLSAVTLAAGMATYGLRRGLRQGMGRLSWLDRFGPEGGYEAGLRGMLRTADIQTRALQGGYLPRYLLITSSVLIVAVGTVVCLYTGLPSLRYVTPIEVYGVVLTTGIVIGAVSVVAAQSRLAAVAYLGVVGFGISLVYVLYSAPDLAMTMFIIETVTVVLFILVLQRLPRFASLSDIRVKIRDGLVAALAGVLMTVLVLTAVAVELGPRVSGFYEEQSVPGAHGRNVVNTILVDFRALDTLGEIAVLGAAALGAYGLLRLRKQTEGPGDA